MADSQSGQQGEQSLSAHIFVYPSMIVPVHAPMPCYTASQWRQMQQETGEDPRRPAWSAVSRFPVFVSMEPLWRLGMPIGSLCH